jgi:putative peptidoglycan lipid II flippase
VAALKVILPAFYARQDTRTPVWVALWTLLLHVALNFVLLWWIPMGHGGLALSTSLSALFNWGALAWIHWRRWGPAWGRASQRALVNCTLASLGMAFACSQALGWLGFHARIGLSRALVLGTVIALGMAVYFGILAALRAPEPAELFAAIRRRCAAPAGS